MSVSESAAPFTAPSAGPSWARRWKLVLGMALVGVLVGRMVWQSVWIVRPGEQAVVMRFGRVDRVVGAGMQLTLPWPVETVTKIETELVRPMPIGWKYLDELVGRLPTPEESQWLTGDTNIVEVKAMVNYKIADPSKFLFNLGGDLHEKTLLVRRFTESELTRRIGARRVDGVLAGGTAELRGEVREVLQNTLDEFESGIDVVSVQILEIRPPEAVKASFEDVSTAKADYGRRLNEADGYARDLFSRSQASAHEIRRDAQTEKVRKVEQAKGAVARFRSLAVEVRAAPVLLRRRMWLEGVQSLLETVEMVVYSQEEGKTTRIVRTRNARTKDD